MTVDYETFLAIVTAMGNQPRLREALSPEELKLYETFNDEGLDLDQRIAAFELLGASSPAGRDLVLLEKYVARQHLPNYREDPK